MEQQITIRPRMIHGRFSRKKGTYGPERNMFEGYQVVNVTMTKIGRRIQIQGPKKEFFLYQTANPLTIIAPPEVEGGDAIKRAVPLFFVSGMTSSGNIQGAEYFALIENELVAYRSRGAGIVEPF